MHKIICFVLIIATGDVMSAGDNMANGKIFNVVKSFYINLCKRDYKGDQKLSVLMYACGEDFIFVRLNTYMNALEVRAFHYSGQKTIGVEVNVNFVKGWGITFSNSPKKIKLNEIEFSLVDKFDIGPEFIVS